MTDDDDFASLLHSYDAPLLDPHVTARAITIALSQPMPDAATRFTPTRFTPWGAFTLGGLATAAALVFLVLPLAGLQIRPVADHALTDLAATQQLAAQDVQGADDIFSLLESKQEDQSQIDNLLQMPDSEPPVWDQFMDRT